MSFGKMEPAKPARTVHAPKDVITLAQRVMGGIDFDPFTTERMAHHEGATSFLHRKDHRQPWNAPGTRKRALLASPSSSVFQTRELFLRLLNAWDDGRIKEAMAWTPCSEALCRLPWLWSQPICLVFPFRRLAGQVWNPKTKRFGYHTCSGWSFIAYFPPPEKTRAAENFKALAAEVSNLNMGRVIRPPGHPLDADWEDAWARRYKEPYDYQPEEIDRA